MPIYLHTVYGCFQAVRTELLLERPQVENSYLALYRECLLTSALLHGCGLIYFISSVLTGVWAIS